MKLITKAIEKQLPGLLTDITESSKVVVKFFTPDAQATWYVLAGDKQPDGDWLFFAYCNLGDPQLAELGYVALSELQSVRGKIGLPVERDMWFEGTLADARRIVGQS